MIEKYNYYTVEDIEDLNKVFNQLRGIIACDLEIATNITDKERELISWRLSHRDDYTEETKKDLQKQLEANGLSHPYYTHITHLSIADDINHAYVIPFLDNKIKAKCLKFLTETELLQLWHNAGFDFVHIYYHTDKKLPKNYIDTMLLYKSLNNYTEPVQCGLKHIMENDYGNWAIDTTEINDSNMLDDKIVKYAAIDAMATFKLFKDIVLGEK